MTYLPSKILSFGVSFTGNEVVIVNQRVADIKPISRHDYRLI